MNMYVLNVDEKMYFVQFCPDGFPKPHLAQTSKAIRSTP